MEQKQPQDFTKLPVMKACCKTCPFKEDAEGRQQNPTLAATVVQRTLFKGHQICHGTEGPNREANNRCKGAFDNNSTIYRRMGIPEDLIK